MGDAGRGGKKTENARTKRAYALSFVVTSGASKGQRRIPTWD